MTIGRRAGGSKTLFVSSACGMPTRCKAYKAEQMCLKRCKVSILEKSSLINAGHQYATRDQYWWTQLYAWQRLSHRRRPIAPAAQKLVYQRKRKRPANDDTLPQQSLRKKTFVPFSTSSQPSLSRLQVYHFVESSFGNVVTL